MVPLSTLSSSTPATPATLSLLQVNGRSMVSLQEQLLSQLRTMILNGTLHPGQRLPSTRALAEQLSVSRNTVLAVFDQLQAEGYLDGSRGSGTYVSRTLPDELLKAQRPAAAPKNAPVPLPRSAEGNPLHAPPPQRPFHGCIPSVADFPIEQWERLRRRVLSRRGATLLNYGSALGDEGLREQVAIYLRDFRGVRCAAEQVIITTGAQQAFGLAARALAPRGCGVWVEDPGYEDAWSAFSKAGCHLLHQPVDEQGLVVPHARPNAGKLVYLTPSRQFPTGVTMSLERRLEWLSFAEKHGLWLIEDDYDSEFRYQGRPLPCLQGLVPNARVLYIGTFSKSLFPSLRLAYAVVPPEHVQAFAEAKFVADGRSPAIDQAVTAEFLKHGHFVRHLRRMRTVYGERIHALQDAAREYWRGHAEIRSTAAGLGALAHLRPDADDKIYAEVAASAGYFVSALSAWARHAPTPPALVLGFAGYSPATLRKAVRELGEAWNRDSRTRG